METVNLTPKQHQLVQSLRLLNCYKNLDKLVTPVINEATMKKSLEEGDKFFDEKGIEKFCKSIKQKITDNPKEKETIFKSAQDELGELKKFVVVFDSGEKALMFKKEAVADSSKN